MVNPVEKLLQDYGPSLSSSLAKLLVQRYGMSEAAARKRVSRPSPNIRRLAYLTFPRNVRFLYLQKDFGSPYYWQNLISALLSSGSAYGLALAALQQRNGILPRQHFQIACGAPLRQRKRLAAETVLSRLKQAQLIDEYDIPGIGPCVALSQGPHRYDEGRHELQARLIAEDILLKAIRSWLQKSGLGSYNKIALRDESPTPRVGTFAWDLTAPSYVGALLEWNGQGKVKNGFIACDVLLGVAVEEEGLRPFISKCMALRSLKKVGRCLQLFVADRYSQQAFMAAKKSGLLPLTPETLFGREVAEGLGQLFEVLRDAAHYAVDADVFAELFRKLASIEGAAVNLRGALFEYLVAEIVRQLISQSVKLNYVLRTPTGEKAEADVVVEEANRRVTFIECKGYQPAGTVPDVMVERWLSKKVPAMYAAAREHSDWKSLDIRFEFWTTGRLSDTSRNSIENAQQQIRATRYTIDVKDADGVRAIAQGLKNKSLVQTLEQHFLKHPMATLEDVLPSRRPVRSPESAASRALPDELEFVSTDAVLEEPFPAES